MLHGRVGTDQTRLTIEIYRPVTHRERRRSGFGFGMAPVRVKLPEIGTADALQAKSG
jgi:hypothetical protein